MATLRDIKQRITAVKNTAKITSAMKMVSAAKMKRAQNAVESARPYFTKLEDMVAGLIGNAGDYTNPLSEKREEVKNIAIILIGSDRGLCGSFNTNMFKSLTLEIAETLSEQYPGANYHYIPVGKKSVGFAKKSKFDNLAEFPGIFTGLNFENATEIVSNVVDKFKDGNIDKVFVYYNRFVNIIKQIPTMNQLLPVEPKENKDALAATDYIFEPSKSEILDVLLPKLVDIIVWRSLLESNAAEQAARMMAMEKATTNANDLIRALELQYNKARQASITKEMLEIVGGAEALKAV